MENCIEPRETLSLTVAFDHDAVDGAPAWLMQGLVERMEGGYSLTKTKLATNHVSQESRAHE